MPEHISWMASPMARFWGFGGGEGQGFVKGFQGNWFHLWDGIADLVLPGGAKGEGEGKQFFKD